MAEYLPLHDDGDSFTRVASASITGGQLVRVSGSNTVAPVSAASADWLGVAAFDANSGDNVTIYCGGVQRPVASGAVTAGDVLVGAASGQVTTNATPGAGQQVAIALTTVASGATVEAKFVR